MGWRKRNRHGRRFQTAAIRIFDPVPSSSAATWTVSEVMEEIILKLTTQFREEEETSDGTTLIDDFAELISSNLPVSFGCGGKKNGGKRPRNNSRANMRPEKFVMDERMIREFDLRRVFNVEMSISCTAQCLGVGPSLPAGSHILFELLDDSIDPTGTRRRFEIDRYGNTRIHSLSEYDKLAAYNSLLSTSPDFCVPDGVDHKYWDQRYRMFSCFDFGIRLDKESWYSVTPEPIADYLSDKISRAITHSGLPARGCVLDCFSGCGGNSISLARFGFSVLAVEIDPLKCEACAWNSAVYTVAESIDIVCADVYAFLGRTSSEGSCGDLVRDSSSNEEADGMVYMARTSPSQPIDVIVMSPPWGGPQYTAVKSFDLRTMFTCGDGLELVKLAAVLCRNIAVIVPRNTSDDSINALIKIVGLPCRVEYIHLYSKHKLTILFLGELFDYE